MMRRRYFARVPNAALMVLGAPICRVCHGRHDLGDEFNFGPCPHCS